jgi:N-acetylglucosaminyldiphosphoundecaprenol N-acetyl-beta-D-mannosaminyltransferase
MSDSDFSKPMFGFSFNKDSLEEFLPKVALAPTPGQGVRLVVTANLDHVVKLGEDVGLRRAYANSWARTIDGIPLLLYSKIRGAGVKQRITGSDLVPILLEKLVVTEAKLFFVVSRRNIAEQIDLWVRDKGFDPRNVKYDIPDFGFENDTAQTDDLVAKIGEHGTTHLFLGVGCPKSEIWVDTHRDRLGDLYAFCVGAGLGYFAGTEARAPMWMRKVGGEWLWRLLSEPRRLAPRYLRDSWKFIPAVIQDLYRKDVSELVNSSGSGRAH